MASLTAVQAAMQQEVERRLHDDKRRLQMNTPNILGIGGGGGGGGYAMAQAAMPSPRSQGEGYLWMIAMRMRANHPSQLPFDHITCAQLNDTTIAAFVIKGGKYVVLEDDANLFPSDTLITQLRMLA